MALNFPSNPSVGDTYSVNGETWQWNGHCWTAIGEPSTYSPVHVGGFPPASPISGDLWWNSTTGDLCIWYVDPDSSQWVSASNPGESLVTVTPEQVLEALLTVLPTHANIAAAVAAGVPTGGLFKVPSITGVSAIRAVATYLP